MFTYQLAKAAIDMMTRVLAIELGPSGIRVNTIKYIIYENNLKLFANIFLISIARAL
jgi:NAD(P)-dependent dehydrogenase (short-subunit alcohol dehydrogenase family)